MSLFSSVLDEAPELPPDGGGVARVRAAPRRVRRLDQLGRQLPTQEPLRGTVRTRSMVYKGHRIRDN